MPATKAVTQNAPATTDPKALLNRTCAQCHSIEVVTNSKMDRESWRGTVANMVSRGATATPDEMAVLTDYLARTYPAQ